MPILLNAGPSPSGWSSLEKLLRCPQLYAYKHVLKLKLRPSHALIRGALIHVALAHYYARLREVQRGGDPSRYYSPLEAMQLAAEQLVREFDSELPLQLATKLCEFPAAYERTWATDQLRVLHVEEVFEVNVGPYRYTARFDLVFEDTSGGIWLVDHKTAARPNALTVARYSMSGQFIGFWLFGRGLWGDRFRGIRINFISGESEPYVFTRESPERCPNMEARFAQTVVDAEERRALLIKSGRDPWNWPKASSDLVCVHSYGRCDAYELCQWGPQGLQVMLSEPTEDVWPSETHRNARETSRPH